MGLLLQNHHISFRLFSSCCFSHKPPFSLGMSQTGCEIPLIGWRIPLGVEEEKGGWRGLDSKFGLRWEGRGHVPVCSHYGDGSRGGHLNGGGGSCGVRWGHSLLSSHSQLLGLG